MIADLYHIWYVPQTGPIPTRRLLVSRLVNRAILTAQAGQSSVATLYLRYIADGDQPQAGDTLYVGADFAGRIMATHWDTDMLPYHELLAVDPYCLLRAYPADPTVVPPLPPEWDADATQRALAAVPADWRAPA